MGGGIGQGGSDLVGKISLAWVVGDYCRWLRAMGSQIIKADGTVVQLPKEKTKQQPRY